MNVIGLRRRFSGYFERKEGELTTGDIYYVDDATGTDAAKSTTDRLGGRGRDPDQPFATIDYAVGQCTASKGDIIFVMPYHEENISAATSLVCDIAGISIIGLGSGPSKPKLTYTAAAGTISVTAANVTIKNIWLYANFTNGITKGITVSATGDGLTLEDVTMEEAAATKEFLIGVDVAAAAHDITIRNFKFFGVLGGTDSSCINFVGASDRTVLDGIYIHGDFSASVIDHLGGASKGLCFNDIVFYQDDAAAGLGVDVHDSSTGMITNCRGMNKKNTVEAFTGNLMGYSECYGSNAVNVQGILKPVADT